MGENGSRMALSSSHSSNSVLFWDQLEVDFVGILMSNQREHYYILENLLSLEASG